MRHRCYRCPCPPPAPLGCFYEFESDEPQCPKCGALAGPVVELCDVHFLVPDAAGPIQGGRGGRWRVGCQPKRAVLAAHPLDDFHASEDARAVSCPSCKGLKEWQEAAGAIKEMRRVLALAREGKFCC